MASSLWGRVGPNLHRNWRALALIALTTSWIATPATAAAWSPNSFDTAAERRLFALVETVRVDDGLRPLRWDHVLATLARGRSKDMVDRNYFDHTIEGTGLHVWDLMDDHGYCYTRVGELIGWDQFWPDDEAALAVFRMFMDSPPHRAGILGSAWDVAGIGAYKGSDDKIIWTVLLVDGCGPSG